jgi:hypothetical protein
MYEEMDSTPTDPSFASVVSNGSQFCECCRIGTKALREIQKWIYLDTFRVEHVSTKKESKGYTGSV